MASVDDSLVGREAVLGVISEAFDRARVEGFGSSLQLVASAGLGKTAVTRAAERRAPVGTVALRCRGVQAELGLPFSGLHALLLPVSGRFAELSDRHCAALDAALEVGKAPMVSEIEVALATLTLFSVVSAEAPLLVIVDDLHWIDATTATVLGFVARRVEHDAVVMLFAGRPEGVTDVGATRVPIEPLGVDATAALAGRSLGRSLPDGVAESLTRATGGNPLAVLETARRLGADLLLHGSELDEPPPVYELIARGFADRCVDLPDDTLAALRLLATMLDTSASTLHRALTAIEVDPAALDAAERRGLIERTPGAVAFSHPLLRSSVFHETPSIERRASYAALATATDDPGAGAWYAASASPVENETLASRLGDHAATFALRGGHLAAAKALNRAARLTPDRDMRADRLRLAAEEARLAGHNEWTARLLEEALGEAVSPTIRTRIGFEQHALIEYSTPDGSLAANGRDLAQRAAAVDAELAREILHWVANEAQLAGDMAGSRAALQSALALGPSTNPTWTALIDLCVAQTRLLTGDDPARGAHALGEFNPMDFPLFNGIQIAEMRSWVEEHDEALLVAERIVTLGRRDGNVRAVTGGLWAVGYVRFRRGEWDLALSSLRAGRELAAATAQPSLEAFFVAVELLIAGARGDTDTPVALVGFERRCRGGALSVMTLYHASAAGIFELAHDRASKAVPHLERAAAWAKRAEHIEPGFLPWPADLVEAYAGAGRADDAVEALSWLRDRADATARPWAIAAVARLEALMAGDDFEARYEHALQRHGETRAPFDRARTQLAYGRRLLESGQRERAVDHLWAANLAFERLGAVAWSVQVEAALTGADALSEAARSSSLATLTAKESVIAGLVADGLTNNAIATELYLSPKTIEWHLRQVFRKLDLRSRVQLATLVRQAKSAD